MSLKRRVERLEQYAQVEDSALFTYQEIQHIIAVLEEATGDHAASEPGAPAQTRIPLGPRPKNINRLVMRFVRSVKAETDGVDRVSPDQ